MSFTLRKPRSGETFEGFAARVLGDPSKFKEIVNANPGVSEPLTDKVTLRVPKNVREYTDTLDKGVNVVINGTVFRYWSEVTIRSASDTPGTIELKAPFQPENKTFRDIFKPLSYPDIHVDMGGKRIFTGYVVGTNPSMSGNAVIVTVTAYARCGVLQDCTIPKERFPLEFVNRGIESISQSLTEVYNIKTINEASSTGKVFNRVSMSPSSMVFSFIAKLAAQRNLILTSSVYGDLVITDFKANKNTEIFFSPDDNRYISLEANFGARQYYSDICAIQPARTGFKGGSLTKKNPHLPSVMRMHTFVAGDVEEPSPAVAKEGWVWEHERTDSGGVGKKAVDLEAAAQAKMSRMFASAIEYVLTVPSDRTPSGEVYRPGMSIMIHEPNVMVYAPYKFTIKAVSVTLKPDEIKTQLTLTVPEAFTGGTPGRLPWDE